jgi:hypothetical protein
VLDEAYRAVARYEARRRFVRAMVESGISEKEAESLAWVLAGPR